ncbi:hypothetical protein MRX96_059343 [Rhipicephalus microplus]
MFAATSSLATVQTATTVPAVIHRRRDRDENVYSLRIVSSTCRLRRRSAAEEMHTPFLSLFQTLAASAAEEKTATVDETYTDIHTHNCRAASRHAGGDSSVNSPGSCVGMHARLFAKPPSVPFVPFPFLKYESLSVNPNARPNPRLPSVLRGGLRGVTQGVPKAGDNGQRRAVRE